MATTGETLRPRAAEPASPNLLNRPEVRRLLWQVILVVGLVALLAMIVTNTAANLRRQNIASGFGFWDRTSGFDIAQSLIDYSNTSTYGRAFLVGLWNTVLVGSIGIVLATILGFVVGIARLSTNWLIARLATIYVEVARNVPLLLQLFIWYFAVLKNLPSPRQSYELPGGTFINVRGLYVPRPIFEPGFEWVFAALMFGVVAAAGVRSWARWRQRATGEQLPTGWITAGLVIGLPLAVHLLLGRPLSFDYPVLQGFNFEGGIVVQPEFVALLAGLVFYTASYIAEIVRAGILGVSKGQKEAARALGLTNGQMLRLVVIPQAMRIIIPPLTSQFLNLTKNSSLAVAIAYPDLVNVAGTILNQTGQAVEVILLIMAVYLTLSLLTSAFMNWFNRRIALVER